jgi:hypothetical protein
MGASCFAVENQTFYGFINLQEKGFHLPEEILISQDMIYPVPEGR